MSDPSNPMARLSAQIGNTGGGAPVNPTEQAINDNKSMFNPTDVAGMATNGEITPDMTIRQFFESQGMDVDGPVTQLVEWQMSQMNKADPLNKMKAIAGQGGANTQPTGAPPAPPGGLPMGNQPPGGAGIAGLKAALQGGR